MTNKYERIYQFKISLEGIKPSIWRRTQVPETYSFWDLHVAIQDAMGWFDCHLHQFEVMNLVLGEPELIGIPDEAWDDMTILPGWEQNIADYFSLDSKLATYLYDFGDNWQHKVLLEKILPREPEVKYPRCIEGARACPPEDCGGVWGYKHLLTVLKNPKHEDYDDMIEWLGRKYEPEKFNPEKIRFSNPKRRFNQSIASSAD